MSGSVQVLLSVHDGRDHLPEQLDSLVAQKGVDLDLLVRDDGSRDRSAEVVCDVAHRLQLSLSDDATRIGLPGTYFRLLADADRNRDAWAFCDQDDVWLPDKLSTAVGALTASEVRDVPTLWVCASDAFDATGPRPGPSRTRRPGLGNALVEAIGPGCCMVWNRALMERLVLPADDVPVLHDAWLYASAAVLGRVLLEPRPLVRYRVHDHNAIGIDTRLRSRIRRHRRSAVDGGPTWEALAQQVAAAYDPDLTPVQRRAVRAMAGRSRMERVRAWARGDLRRSDAVDNLQLLGRLLWRSPVSAGASASQRRPAAGQSPATTSS